jgi:hypothetical protein
MKQGRRGRTLLILAAVCAVFAGFVAATGGIDTRIGSLPVRSRSWERPATFAVVLALAGLFLLRHALRGWLVAAARLVPAALVAWTLFASLWFGTYAAGGADSYGYVSQAELLAHGRLTDTMPEHSRFDWPEVPFTLTPLGYTRTGESDVLLPVYPPGLPMMMAPLALIHSDAVFLLVPICAAITVWLCLALGRELGDPLAGLLGALLLAASPTFLLQAVQPMSDVPVSALWLAALVLARRPRRAGPLLAGVVASLAILVRPNLAPLALLVAAASAVPWPLPAAAGAPDSGPRGLMRAAWCVLAMIPGVVTLGVIQAVRYGSPLASGYGSFHDLFGLSNIAPNLARYPRWLTETHTPLIWLWVLAPLAFRGGDRGVRAFGWVVYGFIAAVLLAYLPYVYFQPHEWSYTRFLLPALPLMTVLGALALLTMLRRAVPRRAAAVAVVICLAVAALSMRNAAELSVFQMRDGEVKYPRVGRFVRERLPPTAFVLAAQHSGSIRYYSTRPTLRWDLLDAAALDRAIVSLRRAGYEPFAVLDAGEDEAFRARFGARRQHAIDALKPIAVIGNTSVYGFN